MRRPAYRDFAYTLVMRSTGKQYTVYGTPIWSQDKARFVTIACSWLALRRTRLRRGNGMRPSCSGLAS